MAKYIRFVVCETRDENPLEADGIFTYSKILKNQRGEGYALSPYEKAIVKETLKWYNENVPVPPFNKLKRRCKWCRCWWKTNNRKEINKARKLIHIIRGYLMVRTLETDDPGEILYEDEFQIVVRPKKRIK